MELFMRGVVDYADRHGGWTILTSPPTLYGAGEHAMSIRALRRGALYPNRRSRASSKTQRDCARS